MNSSSQLPATHHPDGIELLSPEDQKKQHWLRAIRNYEFVENPLDFTNRFLSSGLSQDDVLKIISYRFNYNNKDNFNFTNTYLGHYLAINACEEALLALIQWLINQIDTPESKQKIIKFLNQNLHFGNSIASFYIKNAKATRAYLRLVNSLKTNENDQDISILLRPPFDPFDQGGICFTWTIGQYGDVETQYQFLSDFSLISWNKEYGLFDKDKIYTHIVSLIHHANADELANLLTILKNIRDQKSPLGSFFWYPRLGTKCSLKKGKLKLICDRIAELETKLGVAEVKTQQNDDDDDVQSSENNLLKTKTNETSSSTSSSNNDNIDITETSSEDNDIENRSGLQLNLSGLDGYQSEDIIYWLNKIEKFDFAMDPLGFIQDFINSPLPIRVKLRFAQHPLLHLFQYKSSDGLLTLGNLLVCDSDGQSDAVYLFLQWLIDSPRSYEINQEILKLLLMKGKNEMTIGHGIAYFRDGKSTQAYLNLVKKILPKNVTTNAQEMPGIMAHTPWWEPEPNQCFVEMIAKYQDVETQFQLLSDFTFDSPGYGYFDYKKIVKYILALPEAKKLNAIRDARDRAKPLGQFFALKGQFPSDEQLQEFYQEMAAESTKPIYVDSFDRNQTNLVATAAAWERVENQFVLIAENKDHMDLIMSVARDPRVERHYRFLSKFVLPEDEYKRFDKDKIIKHLTALVKKTERPIELFIARNILIEIRDQESSPLGRFFWRKRLNTEPSLEKGSLKKICELIAEIEKKQEAAIFTLVATFIRNNNHSVDDDNDDIEAEKKLGVTEVKRPQNDDDDDVPSSESELESADSASSTSSQEKITITPTDRLFSRLQANVAERNRLGMQIEDISDEINRVQLSEKNRWLRRIGNLDFAMEPLSFVLDFIESPLTMDIKFEIALLQFHLPHLDENYTLGHLLAGDCYGRNEALLAYLNWLTDSLTGEETHHQRILNLLRLPAHKGLTIGHLIAYYGDGVSARRYLRLIKRLQTNNNKVEIQSLLGAMATIKSDTNRRFVHLIAEHQTVEIQFQLLSDFILPKDYYFYFDVNKILTHILNLPENEKIIALRDARDLTKPLGQFFHHRGDYFLADEYLQKIKNQIANENVEPTFHANLVETSVPWERAAITLVLSAGDHDAMAFMHRFVRDENTANNYWFLSKFIIPEKYYEKFDKDKIYQHIESLLETTVRPDELKIALNSLNDIRDNKSPLGHFFWHKRFGTKPSLNKGTLALICKLITKIEKNLLESKHTSQACEIVTTATNATSSSTASSSSSTASISQKDVAEKSHPETPPSVNLAREFTEHNDSVDARNNDLELLSSDEQIEQEKNRWVSRIKKEKFTNPYHCILKSDRYDQIAKIQSFMTDFIDSKLPVNVMFEILSLSIPVTFIDPSWPAIHFPHDYEGETHQKCTLGHWFASLDSYKTVLRFAHFHSDDIRPPGTNPASLYLQWLIEQSGKDKDIDQKILGLLTRQDEYGWTVIHLIKEHQSDAVKNLLVILLKKLRTAENTHVIEQFEWFFCGEDSWRDLGSSIHCPLTHLRIDKSFGKQTDGFSYRSIDVSEQYEYFSKFPLPAHEYARFDKGALFNYIEKVINNYQLSSQTALTVLRGIRDRKTQLAEFFWNMRLGTKPSLQKGTLKRICKLIDKLEKQLGVTESARQMQSQQAVATSSTAATFNEPRSQVELLARQRGPLMASQPVTNHSPPPVTPQNFRPQS